MDKEIFDEIERRFVERANAQQYGWKVVAAALIIGLIIGGLAGAHLQRTFGDPKIQYEYKEIEKEKPPVVIKGDTVTKESIRLVEPEQQGEVTRIVERDGKAFVVINGQEMELKNDKAQPGDGTQMRLGENGTVEVVKQTTQKVDVTEMVNRMLAAELQNERNKWEKERPKKFGITGGVMYSSGNGLEPGMAVQWQPDKNKQVIAAGSKHAAYGGIGIAID